MSRQLWPKNFTIKWGRLPLNQIKWPHNVPCEEQNGEEQTKVGPQYVHFNQKCFKEYLYRKHNVQVEELEYHYYSWKTGEYKLLWWKISGKKMRMVGVGRFCSKISGRGRICWKMGGIGLFLLKLSGSGSFSIFHRWEGDAFIKKWVGVSRFSWKLGGSVTRWLKNG